ncbi:hypothetical protein JCM13664_07360 [Methylothermus subterraneus]
MSPIKTIATRIGRAVWRLGKVVIGGPLGALAWSLGGAGVVAVLIWGFKTVAMPLLILKTTSWGLWGASVLRQFSGRRRARGPNT